MCAVASQTSRADLSEHEAGALAAETVGDARIVEWFNLPEHALTPRTLTNHGRHLQGVESKQRAQHTHRNLRELSERNRMTAGAPQRGQGRRE